MTEFQGIYKMIREEWLREVRDGIHSRTGMDGVLAQLLGVHQSQVSAGKRGRALKSLTATQWIKLANRFSIPVQVLIKAASNNIDPGYINGGIKGRVNG